MGISSLRKILLVTLATISPAFSKTLYVTPDGKPEADGAQSSPISIGNAFSKAQAGDVIEIAAGMYKLDTALETSSPATEQSPIVVKGDATHRPVLDYSSMTFGSKNKGIVVNKDFWTISNLEISSAGSTGIYIVGHHNTIANCSVHDCQNTGINIGQPGSYNLIVDCDSYRNVDKPTKGQNADGFGCKFNVGDGNIFRNCRAWDNADDGFDLWKAPKTVRIENCVAMRNGINFWNIDKWEGNGNGFKLGGDKVAAAHVVINCVAIDQWFNGFDLNNNTGPQTLENCVAVRCGKGFNFYLTPNDGSRHVLKKCVSLDSPSRLVEGTETIDCQLINVSIAKPTTVPTK